MHFIWEYDGKKVHTTGEGSKKLREYHCWILTCQSLIYRATLDRIEVV